MEKKIYKAVNWNTPENDYVETFWEQNIRQFWIDTEYIPSRDIDSWNALKPEMKLAYLHALGGLTMLDTLQSHTGMPKIIDHIDSLQNRSVLSYMCMMESIHAKSYSTIFTTVASTREINETFNWVQENPHLQYKANKIDNYYQEILRCLWRLRFTWKLICFTADSFCHFGLLDKEKWSQVVI